MTRLILVNRYFHPDESATSQLSTDLARHLAQSRPIEVLASRQLLEKPAAQLRRRATLDNVSIHRLWSTRWGRQWLPGRLLDYLSFLAAVGIWLLLRARRGDVVLAKTDPPLLGVVTTLCTLGRGVHRIQWLQDLFPETAIRLGVVAEQGLPARAVRTLRDWSLRQSELIITVSSGMSEHLRRVAGKARIVHIPNWADDLGAHAASTGTQAAFTVGYSGNLGRAHPIDGLLQLAEHGADPALRFLFSGGGVNHERLRERVQALNRDHWTFLPYQPREQLGALLRRSDLHLVILDPRVERFIFPSKVYGILSAGRPILHLGDPDGEVARLLKDCACGWSIPADSGETLISTLSNLRQSPEKVAKAARNARTAYETKFSRSAALAAWDAALRTV
ncbi:MAG TPA: glycosyltransferase family 4 protein [Verrucomicrobiae bacterium]|nr:glycosyltransferase family 4 protein [Verrucomicrobiae bacterium]